MKIEDRAKELELVTCEIRRGVNRFEAPYRYTDWDKLARHVEGLILEARLAECKVAMIAASQSWIFNHLDICIKSLEAELEKVRTK